MKLHCQAYPYSSIVGGGLVLLDEKGHAKFQLGLSGTTEGISKEQNDSLCQQLEQLINTRGLDLKS